MKKLILTAAAFMVAVAAYGQGQFYFNTRNTSAGNAVTFTLNGTGVSASDAFVEVLAGPSASNLTPLTPLLPLNRSGTTGFPNPFGGTYNAPAGSTVVAYRAYQGGSYATATARSELVTVNQMLDASGAPTALVFPTDPAQPPPELYLGTKVNALVPVPEPTTLALGLLGVGALLAFRRRS